MPRGNRQRHSVVSVCLSFATCAYVLLQKSNICQSVSRKLSVNQKHCKKNWSKSDVSCKFLTNPSKIHFHSEGECNIEHRQSHQSKL